MIELKLTYKEAIVFHMMYTLGAMAMAGDEDRDIIRYAMTIAHFLAKNVSPEEEKTIVDKVSSITGNISEEVIKKFGLLNVAEETIPLVLDGIQKTQFDNN